MKIRNFNDVRSLLFVYVTRILGATGYAKFTFELA